MAAHRAHPHCLLVRNTRLIDRIDIGGKLLTNHLKHLISFRQWNMADETHVVNDVREACSYVSMDCKADLKACKWVIFPTRCTSIGRK